MPDLLKAAMDIERFGADGITVHPRQDERHIRRSDVGDLKSVISTEFNIEGYPSDEFIKLIEEIRPAQATLVPDAPDVITSNAGWDTVKQQQFLKDVIARLHSFNVRVSVFIAPDEKMIENVKSTGTDRVELYTEAYAKEFIFNHEKAIQPYVRAAEKANALGLGINAGHDLNLQNLAYFVRHISGLLEVSIGHALISDALYYGLENTVQMYKREIKKGASDFSLE